MKVEFKSEMGTTHKDFMRLLPASVPGATIEYVGDAQNGAHVVIENAPLGRIEIELSDEGSRTIALLTLPVTHVLFRFFDVEESVAKTELDRMSKFFQRGGG